MSDNPGLALLAAINVLRDRIETGRMPSGIELAPQALAMDEAVIVACERLLAGCVTFFEPVRTAPDTYLITVDAHGGLRG